MEGFRSQSRCIRRATLGRRIMNDRQAIPRTGTEPAGSLA